MITFQENIFNEEKNFVTFEKFYENSGATLGCKVMIGNDTFSDYQIDIFNEVLSEFADQLQSEETYFDTVKSLFEESLSSLNTKLQAFAEKMQTEEHYELSGVIHVIVGDLYISSLIGSSSLMIFRDGVLVYSVGNSPSSGKIDLFSDLIEGDLEDEDTIIVCGTDINTYLDSDDLKKVTSLSENNEISFIQQLLGILSKRIDTRKLNFYQDIEFTTGKKITQKKFKKGMGSGLKFLGKKLKAAEGYSTMIQYVGGGLFVALLSFWALSGFLKDSATVIKDDNGEVLIDFGIDDIQEQIAIFKQIKPNSNDKVVRYNEIIGRLDLLEQNNLRTYDVNELRSILDQDYKDGFNIKLINNKQLLGEPVYVFSQQEKNTMGDINQVFYKDGFHIAGTDGVLIGAINESARGSLVASAIGQTLESCNINLLKSGLLCSSSDGSIYNTDKNGFSLVSTDDKKFPRAISDIGTRRSQNMYVLSNDDRINSDGTYIIKYPNKVSSQVEFAEGTKYVLDNSFNEQYGNPFASGVNSFAIDGTFLVRSQGQKKLYQMYREGTTEVMIGRELPLQGGDNVSNPYSENVKVIASAESRYIYLFDKDTQSFTVYRSTPYKTTPGGERERKPDYAFMVKFDLSDDLAITDVFLEEGEKANLFILTKNSVYKIGLHEYIADYLAKQGEETF